MWPYVLLALTALIGIVSAVIAGTRQTPVWLTILLIILILCSAVPGFLVLRAEERDRMASRYSGVLRDSIPTVLSTRQGVYPKLKLGDSETFFVWTGPQGKPLLQLFENSDLTIWIDNGDLKLSTKIRNKSGDLVAEIIGNEWKLKEEKLWDRNYNANALEVKDQEGDVVLQVLVREDYVQLAAKMYSSSGQGFAIGSTESENGVMGAMEVRPPGQPLELSIEPMFEYPSDLHLGELAGE
jgi:hypothetical protein